MADSPVFEHLCNELESTCSFDRLEARGTVRFALKAGGLDASNLTKSQAEAVIGNLLASELNARGVDGCDAICAELRRSLASVGDSGAANSPEEIFGRLGGD